MAEQFFTRHTRHLDQITVTIKSRPKIYAAFHLADTPGSTPTRVMILKHQNVRAKKPRYAGKLDEKGQFNYVTEDRTPDTAISFTGGGDFSPTVCLHKNQTSLLTIAEYSELKEAWKRSTNIRLNHTSS